MRVTSLLIALILAQQLTKRAPDGHNYTLPTTVTNVPKAHPTDTNPGRPPTNAPGGGGSNTGWIIGGGAAAGGVIALGEWLHAHNQPQAKLSRDGPKVDDQFSMSGFGIGAFCQANWPVVVDYVLDSGILLVTVETQGYPSFTYSIQATGQRQQVIFQLPADFPPTPQPGMYTLRATSSGPGVAAPVYVRLFGIGGGSRSVGSVAIDQVQFGPATVQPRLNQKVNFGFHVHTDFDRIRAEFMKAATIGNQLMSKLEDHEDVNGVRRETTSTYPWDGKKASPGEHILQVRGWESALNKANWVIAWSVNQVMIAE